MQIVEQLQQCYQDIYHQRMYDVPVINSALQVKTIGFQQWQHYYLGVLITPWFINVILLPEQTLTRDLSVGEKQTLVFPSGAYSFIANYEQALGYFWSCSLMSPVLEIKDQKTAEIIATESLKQLLTDANKQEQNVSDKRQQDESFMPEKRKTFLKLLGKDKRASGQ